MDIDGGPPSFHHLAENSLIDLNGLQSFDGYQKRRLDSLISDYRQFFWEIRHSVPLVIELSSFEKQPSDKFGPVGRRQQYLSLKYYLKYFGEDHEGIHICIWSQLNHSTLVCS